MSAGPALGLMRLSTEPTRDEAHGLDVIRAGLEAGVSTLDTSDAYALDAAERGHSERLVRAALEAWAGPRPRVVTKGGLRRPAGRWVPDGRAKWLREACADSRAALGVEAIDLYLLHAPDPSTPLATSARALAKLHADGLVKAVGLCNVSVHQLESVAALAPWSAIQVEVGLHSVHNIRSGVIGYARRHGLEVLAHRPLGGAKGQARVARDRNVKAIAEGLGVTPHQVALAYLSALGLVPLPGPTTTEHATAAARLPRLDAGDLARLDAAFEVHARLREPARHRRPASPRPEAEVVLAMEIPTSGKSTFARTLEAEGYERFNRDEAKCTLAKLHRRLDAALTEGARRVVLDNTYVNPAQRDEVLEVAWRHGIDVRCVWFDVDVEVALVRAALRHLEITGALLEGAALKTAQKAHPNLVLPDVVHRFVQQLEPPREDEGFSNIEVRGSGLTWPRTWTRPGVLLPLDGLVRFSRSEARTPLTPEDVRFDEARVARLRSLEVPVGAWVWAPEVAAGRQTQEDLRATLAHTEAALGPGVQLLVCPHPPGPARCWCRVPLPGLPLTFFHTREVDPAQTTLVGLSAADGVLARRLGLELTPPERFFDGS